MRLARLTPLALAVATIVRALLPASAQTAAAPDPLAARVDPYTRSRTAGSSIRKAGSGIPGQPVATGPEVKRHLAGATSPRVTVMPRVPGTAHIVLAVEDSGTPSLTSYRRVILTVGR